MINNQQVYVNTFAEGALIGDPENITADNLEMVVRNWRRGETVAQFNLFGLETVGQGENRKQFLVGDIGAAKVMLPLDTEFSGLAENQEPEDLLGLWLACVVEDFDFNDEANPVVMLNRKKALERMQRLNARRVVEGGRAYAVIQGVQRRGDGVRAYNVNVSGYPAVIPRKEYDWDYDKEGTVGEGFEVEVLSDESGRRLVSRKKLVPNPMVEASARIKRGMRVKVKVSHIFNGMPKAELMPGVKISINASSMRRVISVGDEIMVQVLGANDKEFYGVVA